jgi:predicted transcriptional regulator
MATRKVTVTLPEEVIERGSELARQAGLPFSTWVAQAAAHEVLIQDGLAAVREWEAENGPITDYEAAGARAELAQADAELARASRESAA